MHSVQHRYSSPNLFGLNVCTVVCCCWQCGLFFQSQSAGGARALKLAIYTGLLVGVCVLFRGVATYMLPIFCVSLLWRRLTEWTAWKQVVAVGVGAVMMVAPYSTYATKKFDSFMVSDRTLGQMMWLGNNDFEPIAFDWGNGPLSNFAFERHTSIGREPCGKRREPVERDKCQTKAGVEWIQSNPVEFVKRVPLRIAQMFNPHSF